MARVVELRYAGDCRAFGCVDDARVLGVCTFHLRLAVKRYLESDERRLKNSRKRSLWTQELITSRMKALALELGHVPTVEDWRAADRRPTLAVVMRIFGTYGNALEAAGLPRTKRGQKPAPVERAVA